MTRKQLLERVIARADEATTPDEGARREDARRLVFLLHANPARTAEFYAEKTGLTVERVTEILDEMEREGSVNSRGGDSPPEQGEAG